MTQSSGGTLGNWYLLYNYIAEFGLRVTLLNQPPSLLLPTLKLLRFRVHTILKKWDIPNIKKIPFQYSSHAGEARRKLCV